MVWMPSWLRRRNDGQSRRNEEQNDSRPPAQATSTYRIYTPSTADQHAHRGAKSPTATNLRKRTRPDDNQDLKETLADLGRSLVGTGNLIRTQRNDKQFPDFSRITRVDPFTRNKMSSSLDLIKRELDDAKRSELFRFGLTNNTQDNKDLLARCSFVWRPRMFFDSKDLEETSLISCPSPFGVITQKVYLHAVLYLHSDGPILAELQCRNGRGREGLPRDKRCEYVTVRQSGEEDFQSTDSLPCLYITGRPVPPGLTINLRPVTASYDEYYEAADGSWEEKSEALLYKYIEALAANNLRLQKESRRITRDAIGQAASSIAENVGDLESYFWTRGEKTGRRTMAKSAQSDADAVVGADDPVATLESINGNNVIVIQQHQSIKLEATAINYCCKLSEARYTEQVTTGHNDQSRFEVDTTTKSSLVSETRFPGHSYARSRDPRTSAYVDAGPGKTGITKDFIAATDITDADKSRTSELSAPTCPADDDESLAKSSPIPDYESENEPPAKKTRTS